ncbi:Na+/H+ antiporter subunit D [Aquisalimonas sp. 2447]|uniref:Na+/H+ antiporter subunit D n=1 Tax=Aquisalimonas sp. 2447 TaxID=2740807 RepID=UPI001432783A|nr:Na+/H+ antiporter subunit D [Aquisalimonas sp. 2447]QIT54813.1 Na+/H+ antiporter subunit D [Aquisalimonas sp. 2447]
MSPEVALPVVIPFLFGSLSIVLYKSNAAQRWLGVIGTGALLIASIVLLYNTYTSPTGVLTIALGDWPAPYGIVLVSDILGAVMTLMASLMGFAVALYSLPTMSEDHEKFGYYPLLHLLLSGVCGAFLTGDIFNLYVWVEVLLVASFALLILGGERAQMEGAIKYVTLNLLSSIMLLSAVGLTYGMTGTLNMADLVGKLDEVENQGLVTVVSMLYLVAFSIKAAAFPLFFWLPASYHTPPVAISALFAGLLTKVGVYALFRFFSLLFNHDVGYTHEILLWIGGFTMVTGVLGAARYYEIRRILSFHIVSQIGYMFMALALFTPLALAGGIYFIIHNIVAKSNLFLIGGVIYLLRGSHELKQVGGLWRERPFLGILFLASALSLAGIPPLSGFIGKYMLVRAGVEEASWGIVAVALGVGMLTLYSMIKIWAEAFWKPQPEEYAERARRFEQSLSEKGLTIMLLPIGALSLLAVLLGVGMQPVYEVLMAAAEQMLDPQIYVDAVLGGDQ